MKSKQAICSPSFRRTAFSLLLAIMAISAVPSQSVAQSTPAAVVPENPANNALAEKRSSGIMTTLKLSDAEKAARVKQQIVNFILTLKNIHEGKTAPTGDAKQEAVVKARGGLYAGLEAE